MAQVEFAANLEQTRLCITEGAIPNVLCNLTDPVLLGFTVYLGYLLTTHELLYDNCSFSIYKNNDAIATAGKTSPTSGTRIDGRFKLIICFTFLKI